MVQKHSVYYMTLIGAISGFVTWGVGVWIPVLCTIKQEYYFILETIDSILISFFISTFCIIYNQLNKNKRLITVYIIIGAAIGCFSGVISRIFLYMIHNYILYKNISSLIIIIDWAVVGSFIGLTVGIIRYGFLLYRVFLSTTGGFLGAAIGSTALLVPNEHLTYLSHVLGLITTGSFIAFSSSYAVDIMNKATLKYIDSNNKEVNEYFKNTQRPAEWFLFFKKKYFIGNDDQNRNDRFIHIPDSELTRSHVYIDGSKEGLFKIKAHNNNRKPDNKIMSVCFINGTDSPHGVPDNSELNDGVLIKIGKTLFQFNYIKRFWHA